MKIMFEYKNVVIPIYGRLLDYAGIKTHSIPITEM